MQKHYCVIAAVDLNARAEGVIRRARKLAQFCQTNLVVVHAVEYDTGFESDHVPFMTPAQLHAACARDARAWMVGLMHHLALSHSEIVVRVGAPAEVIAALAESRRARYVVTGPLKWGRFSKLSALARDQRIIEARCDVLAVGDSRPDGAQAGGWMRRMGAGCEREGV